MDKLEWKAGRVMFHFSRVISCFVASPVGGAACSDLLEGGGFNTSCALRLDFVVFRKMCCGSSGLS